MDDIVTEVLHRPGCRVIRLKGGESLTVPVILFRQSPLKSGDPVDLIAWRSTLSAQERRFALEAAVRLLEVRDRSSAEITQRLQSQGYSQEAVEEAVTKLKNAGYLDDRRFAQAFLMRIGRKYGAIRIRQELRRKGIAQEYIDELLLEQDRDETLETAVKLARHALHGKAKNPQARYRRAYAALARRGFPPDTVRKALEISLSGPDQNEPDAE
jgi:regulatory protein